MDDRGYDDRPVRGLSTDELLRQALQAGHSAGFYAGVLERGAAWSEYEPLLIEARDRRNECFNEIQRRLEAAEALVTAAETVAHKIVATAPGMLDLRAALRPFRQEAHDGN